MLLNTDLHGESVGHQRKMTCNEFIENLSELNDGQNFSRELLRSIYYAIKDSPIPWAPVDEEEIPQQQQQQIPANNSNSFEPISKVVASLSDHPKSGGIAISDEPTMPSNSQDSSKSVASNLSIGQTAGGISKLNFDYISNIVMWVGLHTETRNFWFWRLWAGRKLNKDCDEFWFMGVGLTKAR